MNYYRTGGIGCLLVTGGGALALVGFAVATISEVFSGYMLLAGGTLILVGAFTMLPGFFGLHRTYNSRLYLTGIVFILVGSIPLSVGYFLNLGVILGIPKDPSADILLKYLGILATVGYIFIGAGLIATRRKISETLGGGKERLIAVAGVLIALPIIQFIGTGLLASVFFDLARAQR